MNNEARAQIWEAQRQCITALKQIIRAVDWNDGRKRVAQVMAEYHGWNDDEALRDADHMIQAGIDALKALGEAQEKVNEDLLTFAVEES